MLRTEAGSRVEKSTMTFILVDDFEGRDVLHRRLSDVIGKGIVF